MTAKGAVACGHPATAAAAREILEDGGNAFDAALAALCAAAVAEPVLSSLAGGGFLLAHPAAGAPCLYDFFVETPGLSPGKDVPLESLDFYPIEANFGTATQEFHIGLASVAIPGVVKGLFAIHKDLGRLPLPRLFEPAIALARGGVPLRPVDGYLFEVVGPILTARDDSKQVYCNAAGDLLKSGELCVQGDLANTFEALGREGEKLFYEGEIGAQLVEVCRHAGGLLTREDLLRYRVRRRQPLEWRYRDLRLQTNPPPSTGGILIAFALALLARSDLQNLRFGDAAHLDRLIWTMAKTNQARVETDLQGAVASGAGDKAIASFLDEKLLAQYASDVSGRAKSFRGTTHLSVADAEGNLAALTVSNGEGCGYVLPGSGVMLNNMLGEEDLNPGGFHRWPTHQRLTSMMAPSVTIQDNGDAIALGSGGSNRIRTAILQVLINIVDFKLPLHEAIEAPRLHYENAVGNFEAELSETGANLFASNHFDGLIQRAIAWPPHNLFFGGVHAVRRDHHGNLTATGDPRRGGVALVV